MNKFLPGSRSLVILFVIAACSPAAVTPQPTSPPAIATTIPSPTTFPVVSSTLPVKITQPAAPIAAVETPVRFTFPTPVPVTASLWRPPTYQTPWALSPYDHFYFGRPIGVDEVNWPEPDYRYGGLAEGRKLAHSGVDIAAPRNTPVYAAAAGRVVWAGYGLSSGRYDENDPYGLAVAIDHDFGFDGYRLNTVSAHLDRVEVTVGQRVEPGDLLGVVGTTGITTGPHLHFEVRLKIGDYYSSRNPELWLAPPQGWGVLVARLARADGGPIVSQLVNIRSLASKQTWQVFTYGPNNTHSDDYYQENLVISDLPAGDYEAYFDYSDFTQKIKLSIQPGAVTYFSYQDGRGFNTRLPAAPPPRNWIPSINGQN